MEILLTPALFSYTAFTARANAMMSTGEVVNVRDNTLARKLSMMRWSTRSSTRI